MIPNDKMIISESGVKSREDILAMPANINAVLVGTTLMTSENPDLKIRELRGTVLKICGIRKLEDAAFCEKNFVDFVGLNFVTQSKRCIDLQMAIKIRAKLKNTKCVGVFQNQNLKYVNEIAEILNLDFIQLSGDESLDFVKKCIRPIIKTIRGDLKLAERFYDAGAMILFDGNEPGSGTLFEHKLLRNFKKPFLLAGGINPSNVEEIIDEVKPMGIDIASGVETDGVFDRKNYFQS